MSRLEEIRKKLQAQDRTARGNTGQFDNTVYPHWNVPVNGTALLRFLPDGDPDNVFFWAEKQMIKLAFPGIAGHDESREITIQVPCMEMYGEQCPILTEIRPWFKTELDAAARQYWKKRSYLMQGFVMEDGIGETEVPENPIRRFVVTPQIYDIVKAMLLNPEMLVEPTDYEQGTDFRINKTKSGNYDSYTTSAWARRETALTAQHLEAIEKYGLFTLKDFLPQKPSTEALTAIVEMFEASVDGNLYEPDRWAQYYKPYGFNSEQTTEAATTPSAPVATPTSAPAADAAPPFTPDPDTTVASEAVTSSDDDSPMSTNDILARLKARSSS